ncbi:hypothetical protein EV189_3940 [Motilibacter rhizosphaerae]|uniref:Uncharacterized protein n=1 Tax=Motilibacter rhizosphaerae TaxID=598652 RepID=A0A4Q7N790_9ACTN|nr:hypothetical protein [Motilibacter rhizosphaerae]RZS77902.1 hypothetical protein EV189_3940 [Motilibacter rhizosphaerae]
MTSVEDELRATLQHAAGLAPSGEDLLTSLERRERTQSRRRWAVSLAAAVVGVALASGAALLSGLHHEHAAPAAGGTTSVLRYRGVEVSVPAAWLDPQRQRCGSSVADAAYVARRAVRDCLVLGPEHVEVIAFDSSGSWSDAAAWVAARAAGRASSYRTIADRHVTVAVFAPESQRKVIDATLKSLRVLNAADVVDGCAATTPDPSATGPATIPFLIPQPSPAVRICSYNAIGGTRWLSTTRRLSGQAVTGLARQIATGAGSSLPADDCPPQAEPPYLADSWVLVFDSSSAKSLPTRVDVEPATCGGPPPGAAITGQKARAASSQLLETLARYSVPLP